MGHYLGRGVAEEALGAVELAMGDAAQTDPLCLTNGFTTVRSARKVGAMATGNASDPLRPLGVTATEKRSLLLWRECPLCGGTDVQETTGAGNTYGVVCDFCLCSISGYASREEANKRWNYRYHEHREEGE